MKAASADVDVIYYLVHSLSKNGFVDLDRRAAAVTAQAAREAGVKRIVYLGGLRPDEAGAELSEHLSSRAEVGDVLLASGVPTAVLQAAVILGAGSASFEMLRYLTERLPVMVTPRWVDTRVQPIAVRDVLHYLVGVAALPAAVSRTFDIGGPDVLTYRQMMQRYAAAVDLPPRRIIPVPVLTPWLSSQWVNVVTPVPRSLATPLIESLVHEVVCREHDIAQYIPDPSGGLTGYTRAVQLALAKIKAGAVETRWSDAAFQDVPTATYLSGPLPSDPLPTDPDWSGGSVYTDRRCQGSSATPDRLWAVVTGIGGSNGWYSFPLAWAVRGWVDRLAGGVGLRRGRSNPASLHVGEALDWWRVETLDERGPERVLRLRAEMKVPGNAWLELSVAAGANGGSVYRQRAVFVPRGLAGHVYWWTVAPFHGIVFGGMARNITGAAQREAPARVPAG